LYAKYEKLFEKVTKTTKNTTIKPKPIILLSHVPPFKTKLDELELKKTNVSLNKKTTKKIHVGSQLVRRLIDEFQPNLALSGHMHENSGTIKIKKTICINGGLAKKFTITIHENKPISKLLTITKR
jgi:uncharacterized protein